jgi:hypothetical protein
MTGSAVSMIGALTVHDPSWVVGLVILGLTLHPFTLAGLFCTPNDLSTKYAGARGGTQHAWRGGGARDEGQGRGRGQRSRLGRGIRRAAGGVRSFQSDVWLKPRFA